MAETLNKILTSILTTVYQNVWFSLVAAVLSMFAYFFVRKYGLKRTVRIWIWHFRREKEFRKYFALSFYTFLVLFRTLLNRSLWLNPLSSILGGWGLHGTSGSFSTDSIENFLLLLPFVTLLFWASGKHTDGKASRLSCIFWSSIKTAFCFSLGIECCQLLLRLGTFQLSDLCYNTLGGGLGGVVYWIGHQAYARWKVRQT